MAVENGHLEVVDLLLSKGAKVDEVSKFMWYMHTTSVSNQFIGQKINPFFLAVKISYRMHSCLNTTSRVQRLIRRRNIPAK